MREANFSAEEPQAQPAARLQGADADPGWPCGSAGATPQGTSAAVGVIWRVSDRATFGQLARTPRKRRAGLSLAYVPGADGPPRVAYAVARRVGGATERNLVRRRLRHAVRSAGDSLVPGAYLFGASASVKTLEFSRLRTSVAALVKEVSGAATSITPAGEASLPGRG